MTCGFINDMSNFANFTGVLKNFKICTFRDFELKNYTVVMS